MSYTEFLRTKARVYQGNGIEPPDLPPVLYDWQAAIVRWALKKGRACVFADCGLGKTYMQVAWAHALRVPTLILAPLCVAEQTVDEATALGVDVAYAQQPDASDSLITITNYERLHQFDVRQYQAVVLDESSILKAFDGKTRTKLIRAFRETPYRLCCTATPSPNDIAELANHAEFLGLMTRAEFLATWFVHDDNGWRMKRHAVTPFYRWMASWAIALRAPSDLGYSDEGFELPPLTIHDKTIEVDKPISGALFPELGVKGIGGRLAARRASVEERVAAAAELVSADAEPWIVWCGLNSEADLAARQIPGAVNVQGSDSYDAKRAAVLGFCRGEIRVILSKPRILGFGMNFQHCASMAFVGLSDSYESYYQCLRRCWRFGQRRPVDAHIVVSDAERLVVDNVRRKEADARHMTDRLLEHIKDFERMEVCA